MPKPWPHMWPRCDVEASPTTDRIQAIAPPMHPPAPDSRLETWMSMWEAKLFDRLNEQQESTVQRLENVLCSHLRAVLYPVDQQPPLVPQFRAQVFPKLVQPEVSENSPVQNGVIEEKTREPEPKLEAKTTDVDIQRKLAINEEQPQECAARACVEEKVDAKMREPEQKRPSKKRPSNGTDADLPRKRSNDTDVERKRTTSEEKGLFDEINVFDKSFTQQSFKEAAKITQEIQASFAKTIGWDTKFGPGGTKRTMMNDLRGFEPTCKMQQALSKFVHGNFFQVVAAIVVLVNSILIGVQLHLDTRGALRGDDELKWDVVDAIFTLLFASELILRVLTELSFFVTGPAKLWNFFDTLVVITGIVELLKWVDFKVTYLRLLRVVKVIKIFRVIRVLRFFRELRMMALSIISCLVSVVWAFILLFIVMYLFCMVLLEGARNYMRPPEESSQDLDPQVVDALWTYFDGVWWSLFSLIQAVSGGNSWGDLAVPLSTIHWFYGLAFSMFVTFVMFGLLNVLIGVFVQSTSAIAELDRDFVIQEEMARNQSAMNQMRDLFLQVDTDNTGTVTWAELKANLDDEAVKGYFSLVEIEITEAEGLFHLLDIDESGEVGIEEFIMGCMRLKGAAKSIDMATLLYENKRLHVTLNSFMKELKDEISVLHRSYSPDGECQN